jgi:hypothetical protein
VTPAIDPDPGVSEPATTAPVDDPAPRSGSISVPPAAPLVPPVAQPGPSLVTAPPALAERRRVPEIAHPTITTSAARPARPSPAATAPPVWPSAAEPTVPVIPLVSPAGAPGPTNDDLMPSRHTPSRRARRQAQRRRSFLIGGAILAAVVLAVGAAVWAVSGDDGRVSGDNGRATGPGARTSVRTAPRDRRTSTTTASSAATSTTTVTAAPTAPAASPAAPSGAVSDLAAPGEVTARIEQTPGACRYDADAGELMNAGTLHNPSTTLEAAIEIEVTFVDATGELDTASDFQSVGPGQTVSWEASTLAFDPPSGTLSCQVSQI